MGGLGLGSWPSTHWHGSTSDFLILNLREAHFHVVQFVCVKGRGGQRTRLAEGRESPLSLGPAEEKLREVVSRRDSADFRAPTRGFRSRGSGLGPGNPHLMFTRLPDQHQTCGVPPGRGVAPPCPAAAGSLWLPQTSWSGPMRHLYSVAAPEGHTCTKALHGQWGPCQPAAFTVGAHPRADSAPASSGTAASPRALGGLTEGGAILSRQGALLGLCPEQPARGWGLSDWSSWGGSVGTGAPGGPLTPCLSPL